MVPLLISLVRVHGLVACFLMATESPLGLMGYPTTVTLALPSHMSVSRTGDDSQYDSPVSFFSLLMRFLISLVSAMRLVLHLTWVLNPSTRFMVMCMRLRSHGAST